MAAAIARKSRTSICFLFPNNNSLYYLSTVTTKSIEEFLIEKYHFSPETVSKLVSVSSRLKHPQRTYSGLEFLKETGFSNSQLEKVVRRNPRLVYFKGIKSKIKCFEDFGFSAVQIAAIVANDPSILCCSTVNKVIPSLYVLKDLLGSNAQVFKLLTRHGWPRQRPLEKTLLPNIEFLKSCGVTMEQINSMLYTYYPFFLLCPENMRRYVRKVDVLGVDRNSKTFINAVRIVSTMSDTSWELKLKDFRDLGFSEEGIVRVFRSNPSVFGVSRKKIRKVKEVLLETGKYDLSSIQNSPASLTNSVEKRYKPRLQILKDLEEKGLICKWPQLGTLRTMSDNKFRMRYVALLGK